MGSQDISLRSLKQDGVRETKLRLASEMPVFSEVPGLLSIPALSFKLGYNPGGRQVRGGKDGIQGRCHFQITESVRSINQHSDRLPHFKLLVSLNQDSLSQYMCFYSD